MEEVTVSTITGEADPKGSEEHIQEMVDLADGKEPTPPAVDDEALKAELLDLLSKQEGGFKAAIDKLKSEPAPAPAEEPKVTEPEAEPEKVEAPRADLQKYTDEFVEKGSLSDASYAELEKMGFDRPVVDAYIEGQRAIAERNAQSVFSITEGKDNYMGMVQWAKENLTPSEVEEYNALVTGPQSSIRDAAISGLYAKFRAANGGHEPRLVQGVSSASPASGFGSWAEVERAMSDPRYKADPAYRAQVAQRIQRSSF